MATRRKRRSYIDADVEDAINTQFDLGRSPSQAQKVLSADERFASRLPNIRTFQRLATEHEGPEGEPWAILDGDPADGPAILAALKEVMLYSNGERAHLSKAEAARIGRISRLAPDIPPLAHFLLAKHPTERNLQVFLALAPWRSDIARYEYLGRWVGRAGLRIPLVVPMPVLIVNDTPETFWEAVARMWYEAPGFVKALGRTETGGDDEPQG